MDFSCAAALAEGVRCFATGARAADVASGYSRGGQALRAGFQPPVAAKSPVRALAAAGRAAQSRGLHLFRGTTRGRRAAARHAHIAQALGPRSRAQSNQALHSGGLPSGTGEARPRGPLSAPALRREALGGDDQLRTSPAGQALLLIARSLRCVLRGYRLFVSPVLPRACRFHPSCSEYAEEAVARHGAWRGSWLAARRVCRCAPWHVGGYDPVP